MPRRRTFLLSAILAAALAAPASAQAANACRAHAEHAKVLAQSNSALVYRTGPRFERYVRACRFAAPRRSYRLPGQDGGNANRLLNFRLNGRYLAYEMRNAEEASQVVVSFVYSVDLRKRRKLIQRQSGGRGSEQRTSTEVTGLVVGRNGAIAWIVDAINLGTRLSVRTAAPGRPTAVLDRGNDIRRGSLALAGNGRTVYWTRGATAKSAGLP